MNPPPFLEIDEELRKLFKQACEKYLAYDNSEPEIVSVVTSILLGEQWGRYGCVIIEGSSRNMFIFGLHTILPSSMEINGYPDPGRPKWNKKAYKMLLAYLTDTEYHFEV